MLKPLQVMVRICRKIPSGAVAENVELIVWGLRAVVVPQDGWKASGCLTENGAGSPKPTWRKSQVARRASATSEKISASNMSHRNWRERINCFHCILSRVEGAAQLLSCTLSFWITALTYVQNTIQVFEWTNMTLLCTDAQQVSSFSHVLAANTVLWKFFYYNESQNFSSCWAAWRHIGGLTKPPKVY